MAIVLGASLLAGASWPRRCPGIAIVLWQSFGLSWGLAAVGALVGFGVSGLIVARGSDTRLRVTEMAAQRVDRLVLDGSSIGPFGLVAVLRLISLAAGITLLALLVWILAAAATAVFRARHRQRALLGLLAHDDPKVPGALVVDHPAAAAYCVLDLLDADELAAVLAHERAHLRARHDLVLLPFSALLKAFRWSAIARAANAEVALLVEMLADDRARRRRPARELATALLRVGASGGGFAPAGALAVSGSAGTRSPADGELAPRVTRLLRPPPAMRFSAKAGIGILAALIVLAPATALLIPL